MGLKVMMVSSQNMGGPRDEHQSNSARGGLPWEEVANRCQWLCALTKGGLLLLGSPTCVLRPGGPAARLLKENDIQAFPQTLE